MVPRPRVPLASAGRSAGSNPGRAQIHNLRIRHLQLRGFDVVDSTTLSSPHASQTPAVGVRAWRLRSRAQPGAHSPLARLAWPSCSLVSHGCDAIVSVDGKRPRSVPRRPQQLRCGMGVDLVPPTGGSRPPRLAIYSASAIISRSIHGGPTAALLFAATRSSSAVTTIPTPPLPSANGAASRSILQHCAPR